MKVVLDVRTLSGPICNNLYPAMYLSYPHAYHIFINLYCNYRFVYWCLPVDYMFHDVRGFVFQC